jgi:hypothetical protein
MRQLTNRLVIVTGASLAASAFFSAARAQQTRPPEPTGENRPSAAPVEAANDDPLWPFGPAPPPFPGISSARLRVIPRETEVYVDGRLAGIVDAFDGFTQRLRVPAGGHELLLYHDGYKSVREKLLFEPGTTYKIKCQMQRLGPGETSGPRPEPPKPAEPRAAASEPRPSRPRPPEDRAHEPSAFGTLSIRVQPADATVIVDGERWEGPAERKRLAIEVSGGTHPVEIRKDGYEPFSTRVRVRPGETTTLNVSLPRLESH